MNKWYQTTVSLSPMKRGFHCVYSFEFRLSFGHRTNSQSYWKGTFNLQNRTCSFFQSALLRIFPTDLGQHTSASLTVNENYDPDVRKGNWD